jgi:hypothetical protein
MRRVIGVVFCLIAASAVAQEPASSWSLRFSRVTGSIQSISRTSGGVYIDVLLGDHACVDFVADNGSSVPQVCFGVDVPYNVIAASGGGFFLYGSRGLIAGNVLASWVARFDRARKLVWARRIESSESILFDAASATPDGGVILVGSYGEISQECRTGLASQAIKISAAGEVDWVHVFDVTNCETLTAVHPVADGYIVSGTAEPGAWIARLDHAGSVVWRRWFSSVEEITSVGTLANGDVVAGGSSSQAYWIVRISADGEVRWQKSSKHSTSVSLHNLVVRSDGTLAGYGVDLVNQKFALVLFVMNVHGDIVWQRQIHLAKDMYAGEMALAGDDSILVSVWTQKFAEIHRFSPDGQPPACLADATVTPDIRFEPFARAPVSPVVAEPRVTVKTFDDPPKAVPIDVETEACTPLSQPTGTTGAPSLNAAQQKAREISLKTDQAEKDLGDGVVQLLASKKFAELDHLGDELRASHAVFDSGYPKLAVFYAYLTTPAAELGSEDQHLRLIDDWRKASPHSVSAAVAAASTLFAYSFQARGTGFSSVVTSDAWKTFDALRARAEELQRLAPAAAVDDPEFHIMQIKLAGTQCKNLEGVTHDPRLKQFAYFPLWQVAAYYYLPRWCGSPDEVRKFAEYAAESTESKLGEGLYGLIAWDVFVVERKDRQIFGAYKFAWPRVRQGFLDLIARYPNAPLFYHRLAFLARYYDDRATARSIFAKPQSVWVPGVADVWGNQGYYEDTRMWSETKPAESFMARPAAKGNASTSTAAQGSKSLIAAAASKWPPLLMINDVRLNDGPEYHFNSFLVQTKAGVVAISALTKFGRQQTYAGGPSGGIYVNAMPVNTFRARLKSWTMYAPGKPAVKVSPASIEAKAEGNNVAVVLTFAPSTKLPPVHVLKPLQSRPRRGYVVACRTGKTLCQQFAIGGDFKGGGFLLDEPIAWEEVVGSPVIDENGEVIAVALGPGIPTMRVSDPATFISAEDVSTVLALAGFEP